MYDYSGTVISKDPVNNGLNWYAYANNNPLRYVDPTGLNSTSEIDYRAYGLSPDNYQVSYNPPTDSDFGDYNYGLEGNNSKNRSEESGIYGEGETTEDEKAEVDEEKSNKDLIKELNELIAELENKRQLNDAQKTRVKTLLRELKSERHTSTITQQYKFALACLSFYYALDMGQALAEWFFYDFTVYSGELFNLNVEIMNKEFALSYYNAKNKQLTIQIDEAKEDADEIDFGM